MKPKIERVRELRKSGLSLHDAKVVVERQDLDVDILNAQTVDDLKSILWALTARIR